MSNDKNKDEWIEAIEALRRVEERFGGLGKPALLSRMSNKEMKIKASKVEYYVDYGGYRLRSPKVGEEPSEKHIVTGADKLPRSGQPGIVFPSSFKNKALWDADIEKWDWYEGRFQFTFALDPLPRRVEIFGAKFLTREIENSAKFRRHVDQVRAEQSQKPTIERAKKWDWEGVLIKLVAAANYSGVESFADKPGALKLVDLEHWIAGNIDRADGVAANGDQPDENDVRKRAQRVMAAWKSYTTLK